MAKWNFLNVFRKKKSLSCFSETFHYIILIERHFYIMLQYFTAESLGEADVLLSYNKGNKTEIASKTT